MASLTCICCSRALSRRTSIERGLGPICAARKASLAAEGLIDPVDLPFDPVSKDIICERRDGVCHFNIYQMVAYHSPTGFEWGYGGSGPADFALNILELFMREKGIEPSLRIRNFVGDGPTHVRICQASWDLHQDFKFEVIARIPKEGGTLLGDHIRAWIKIKMAEFKLAA